jgi:hypothetical protein
LGVDGLPRVDCRWDDVLREAGNEARDGCQLLGGIELERRSLTMAALSAVERRRIVSERSLWRYDGR